MPNGYLTFLDLKKQDTTPGYDLVEENIKLSPELSIFPADVMAGTSIDLTVRTDLPTVGFTNIGEGVTPSKSGYITRLFQTANLDALVKLPVGLLQGKPQALGAKLMSNEQSGFVEAAIRHIAKQTWYGVGNDAKGFIGLVAQMLADATHNIDAEGTTADGKSSVYFLSVGANKLEYWFGSNRTLTFDDWVKQTVKDEQQRDMEALTSWMHANVGLRLANRNAVLRIKNITEQGGHTLTWTHMYKALRQMRDDCGQNPTHIFMTGRSQEQLRQARITDLLPDPPLPKDLEGIPFVITHGISNAETI